MQMHRQQSLEAVREIILRHMQSFDNGSIHFDKARLEAEALFGVDHTKELFREALSRVLSSVVAFLPSPYSSQCATRRG
jgi:hypothetical protein